MDDSFKTYDDQKITVRPNGKKIIHKGNRSDYRSIYGSFIIDDDCNKTTWIFKIHKIGESISIGIDSSNAAHINTYFYKKKGSYAYEATGSGWHDGHEIKKYGEKYGKDDIVSMTYNGSDSTLIFQRETKKRFGGTKIKNYEPIKVSKKKKYQLCVCLYGKGGCVELMDFITSEGDSGEEEKTAGGYNDTPQYRTRGKGFSGTAGSGTGKHNDKDQEIMSLKTENAQLKQEVVILEREMELMKQQLMSTSRKNTILMDEQKELLLENEELKQEVQTLRLNSMDNSNYENWNAQQIISWIITLEDGRFKKYEETLTKVFEEEEINGSLLAKVDVADVKSWGVKSFGDKKDLAQYIQDLVAPKTPKNGNKHQRNVTNGGFGSEMEGVDSGGHYH